MILFFLTVGMYTHSTALWLSVWSLNYSMAISLEIKWSQKAPVFVYFWDSAGLWPERHTWVILYMCVHVKIPKTNNIIYYFTDCRHFAQHWCENFRWKLWWSMEAGLPERSQRKSLCRIHQKCTRWDAGITLDQLIKTFLWIMWYLWLNIFLLQ